MSVKQTLLGLSFWPSTLSIPFMLGWLGFLWGLLLFMFQNDRGIEDWYFTFLLRGEVMLSCLCSLTIPSISSGLLFHTIRQQINIQQVSDEKVRGPHHSLSKFNRLQFYLSMVGFVGWILFIFILDLSIRSEGTGWSSFAYSLGFFSLMALVVHAVVFFMTWTKSVRFLDFLQAQARSAQNGKRIR